MQKTLEKDKIIPLTYDIMFTEIFNSEEAIHILEELISIYFGYNLADVRENLKILSRRLGRKNRLESRKEVDLLLDYKGNKINVEMSNTRSEGVVKRNVAYAGGLYFGQVKKGDDDYSQIDDVIQIMFNNFNYPKKFVSKYCIMETQEREVLVNNLTIYIINLVKGKNLCYTDDVKKNYLLDLCKLLTEDNIDNFTKLAYKILSKESAKILIEKVKRLSGDDEMLDLSYSTNKTMKEVNTARKEINTAREEINAARIELNTARIELNTARIELEEKAKNIVLNMLKDNLPIETIAKYTGLSKEEIQKLA